jgi:hypothetical protein
MPALLEVKINVNTHIYAVYSVETSFVMLACDAGEKGCGTLTLQPATV